MTAPAFPLCEPCPVSLHPAKALPVVEKRATVIQLVDAWRSTKSADAEAAKAARAMSKDECEEVNDHEEEGGRRSTEGGAETPRR